MEENRTNIVLSNFKMESQKKAKQVNATEDKK